LPDRSIPAPHHSPPHTTGDGEQAGAERTGGPLELSGKRAGDLALRRGLLLEEPIFHVVDGLFAPLHYLIHLLGILITHIDPENKNHN
jgi:hypothetical protein